MEAKSEAEKVMEQLEELSKTTALDTNKIRVFVEKYVTITPEMFEPIKTN